jgi:hypothetical protein
MDEKKREALNRLVEEFRAREMRAWVLAGFVLYQIGEDSRASFLATRRFIAEQEAAPYARS